MELGFEQESRPSDTAHYRLPRDVVPSHYALEFEPDLVAHTFTGTAEIDVEVLSPVSRILVNSAALDLNDVTVRDATGEVHQAAISYQPDEERATFELPATLQPGTYVVSVAFSGRLEDDLRGFYRSTYRDAAGVEHTIATTQLQSTSARRAFPCWDEPDFKATFGVTLVVPHDLMAISNSPVIARDPVGEGKIAVKFKDTMVMPTYLVTMIVGDLEATEPVDVDGVPLRIVHVPGKSNLTDFALELGAFSLRYLVEYLGLPYPGDKLDMIGIPDFAQGAMENLGAVTYRESDLLIDRDRATQAELTRVADVISHELAHMWFGDLVTMKWWDGVWLNEAFASLMEARVIDAYRPEWKRRLDFAIFRAAAMDVDGLEATRAIQSTAISPDDIDGMFDVLTYRKGHAVLRMLELYLGEEPFRAGVSGYLARHSHGNTEASDVWAALEESSGEPVGRIMANWLLHGGFPQLVVSREGNGYQVRQEQFRYLEAGTDSWMIPARYSSSEGAASLLVSEPAKIKAGEDLLFNHGGEGYYRVRYEGDLGASVRAGVGSFSGPERFSILSDTFAFVLSSDLAARAYVDLTSRFSGEPEPVVWNEMLRGLGELDRVLEPGVRPRLQEVVSKLIAPSLDRVGWEPQAGEPDLQRQLRGVLIRGSGNLAADPATRERARDVLERWLADPDSVDGDVGSAALAVVAYHGNMDDFNRLHGLWRQARTPQSINRFRRAMSTIPEPEAMTTMIAMALDGRIKRQDAPGVFALALGHRDVGAHAWPLIRERWHEVIATPAASNRDTVIGLVHFRSEPEIAAEIRRFFTAHPVPGHEAYTNRQLERLEVRVGLRRREGSGAGLFD